MNQNSRSQRKWVCWILAQTALLLALISVNCHWNMLFYNSKYYYFFITFWSTSPLWFLCLGSSGTLKGGTMISDNYYGGSVKIKWSVSVLSFSVSDFWPAAEEAVLDDLDDEAGRLLLAHRRIEALPGGQVNHYTKHWNPIHLTTREEKHQAKAQSADRRPHRLLFSKCREGHTTHLRSLMVCPLKQGRPVSSISVTKETTASM